MKTAKTVRPRRLRAHWLPGRPEYSLSVKQSNDANFPKELRVLRDGSVVFTIQCTEQTWCDHAGKLLEVAMRLNDHAAAEWRLLAQKLECARFESRSAVDAARIRAKQV